MRSPFAAAGAAPIHSAGWPTAAAHLMASSLWSLRCITWERKQWKRRLTRPAEVRAAETCGTVGEQRRGGGRSKAREEGLMP